MSAPLVAAASFVLMEPFTAAMHRYVMHGVGFVLHRSHHAEPRPGGRRRARFEPNDAFPVMIAGGVVTGLVVGYTVPGWSLLVPIGTGITLYGLCYAAVHDVYIHRRLSALRARRVPGLERLAAAHRVHHDLHGPPYGMLLPVVGRRRTPASGSRPSHRPAEA